MIRMMDEAETNGTPVLQWLEPRAEDANVRGRYQRQLCLGLTEFSRVLGPFVIGSVAFTGSDPFLRVGTDVAVLFEAKNPALLRTHILAQQNAARTADPAVQAVNGTIAGVEFAGVLAADRSISSYVASLTNVVLVSNSRAQLERLIRTAQARPRRSKPWTNTVTSASATPAPSRARPHSWCSPTPPSAAGADRNGGSQTPDARARRRCWRSCRPPISRRWPKAASPKPR
ncbi:MAG: hypothetical protein M5U12_01280 [Verrucomicrobia bacterium]|nr:hypothetical protein [Verrucomicrobiota bacterium]